MKRITDIPMLPDRCPNSHKGTYGKVAIIGGSIGMSGAPVLAGKAALRTGSGLVRLAVPESIQPVVASMEPCYTTVALSDDQTGKISDNSIGQILKIIEDNDVIAFGPGCGIGYGIKKVLQEIIKKPIQLVIDADGLNNLCSIYKWWEILKADTILTPHPGEMARLWNSVFREDMPNDRIETAVKFSERTDTVVLLKGHETVVAQSGKYYVNTTGNPGMATAGAGDVLTGMVLSMIGQGLDNFDAAVLGAYEHGLAGDRAVQERSQRSIIASDIIENII